MVNRFLKKIEYVPLSVGVMCLVSSMVFALLGGITVVEVLMPAFVICFVLHIFVGSLIYG